MSNNAERIAGLEGYLLVAEAQAELTVADIAFCLQRDHALTTEAAFATAQVIKERSQIAALEAKKELAALTKPPRIHEI